MNENNNDWIIDGYNYEQQEGHNDYAETPNEDWIDTGHYVEDVPEKRGMQNPLVIAILIIGGLITLWIVGTIISVFITINKAKNFVEEKAENVQEYFEDKNYGAYIPPDIQSDKEGLDKNHDNEVIIEEHPGEKDMLKIELIDGQIATIENIRDIAANSIKVVTGIAKQTNNGKLLECYDYICNTLTVNTDNQNDLAEEVRFPATLGNYTVREDGLVEGVNFSIEGIGYSTIIGSPEKDIILNQNAQPGDKICFILMRSDVYEAIRTIEKEKNVVLLDMGIITAGTLPMMDLTLADFVIDTAPNMIGKIIISASNGELAEEDLQGSTEQLSESADELALAAIKKLYMYSVDHDISISAEDLDSLKSSISDCIQIGEEKIGEIFGSEEGWGIVKNLLRNML